MRYASLVGRLLILPSLVVALTLAAIGAASAQDEAGESEATLEIHKSECFHGVGSDIFEECHENTLEGISFTVNGAEGTTDENGRISFHGPAATVTITESPDVFAQYLGAYVYCRDLTDDEVLFDGSATDTGGVVTLEIEDGDQVVCDWYDITEAEDTGDDDGGTGGTTSLPKTGSGIVSGERGGETFLLVAFLGALAIVSGFVCSNRGRRSSTR